MICDETGVRNLGAGWGARDGREMKISGSQNTICFDRYNITSEEDLKEAADRLDTYIQQKKFPLPVTLEPATKPE